MKAEDLQRIVGQRRNAREVERRRHHKKQLRRFHARAREYYLNYQQPKRTYADMVAPSIFSVVQNRSETITYLKQVDRALKNEVYANMDFSDIQKTDLPTICLLSAYMLDPRTKSSFLKVKIPAKGSAQRKIWDESDFEHMIIKAQRQNFRHGRFLSRSNNDVNTAAIDDILKDTLEFFGKERLPKLVNLSPVIVEIVENTAYHANPDEESALPWIINTHQTVGSGYLEMEYCIVDLGVGIYDSIRKHVLKWNTVKAKIEHRLAGALYGASTQSRFLAENIPKGIGSSTNEEDRGKGVHYVYRRAQDDIYQLFDIITNKAEVKLKEISTICEDAEESLEATIYYWKIRIYDDGNS